MHTRGIQQVNEESTLIVLLDPNDFLRDVLAGTADATNRQEEIIMQKISRQYLPPTMNNASSSSSSTTDCQGCGVTSAKER